MSTDLLAPACAAVLDGWCGPASWQHVGRWHTTAWDGEHFWDDAELRGFWDDTTAHLALDFTRAEVRDRVARVLAAREGMSPRDSIAWYYTGMLGGWLLHARGPFVRMTDEREHSVAYCVEPDFESWGRWPCLASLDPHDDTRLPDGSRRVDALALRAVYLEVCCGK